MIRSSRACCSCHDINGRRLLLTRKSYWINDSLTIVTITWLTVIYLCHRWPRTCSVYCNHNPVFFGQIYYQMSISSKLFVIASGEANVYGSSYYWNFRTSSFKQVACLILFTIIKTILSTVFLLFLNFTKNCKMSVDRYRVEHSGNDNSGYREWYSVL